MYRGLFSYAKHALANCTGSHNAALWAKRMICQDTWRDYGILCFDSIKPNVL